MKLCGIQIPFTKKGKEEMAKSKKYQGQDTYKKIDDKLKKLQNKCQENDLDSLLGLLKNLEKEVPNFEELEEEKKKEIDKFKTNFHGLDKCSHFKNKFDEIAKLFDEITNKKPLESEEEIETPSVGNIAPLLIELLHEVAEISKTLKRVEKEDLKMQGQNIDEALTKLEDFPNDSFWKKLKDSIPSPKFPFYKSDLTNVENGIRGKLADLENLLNNKFKGVPKPPKIPDDYAKKDDLKFEFEQTNRKLKSITEATENLETLPAKISKLEEKLSELQNSSPTSSEQIGKVPKEERAIADLSQFMRDGLAQLENISKEYVSKRADLEKLEKLKSKHSKELQETEKESFQKGVESGKIETIKKIFEKFPTDFENISPLFSKYLETKFEVDEVLQIINENKNEIAPFIDGEFGIGEYIVKKSATILNGEVLSKAKIEKKPEEKPEEETQKDGD
jgi:DNA repair exonuclease SbcCD ATPase subunit